MTSLIRGVIESACCCTGNNYICSGNSKYCRNNYISL